MTISSVECKDQYKIKVMAKIMPIPHKYGMNPQPTKDMLRSKGLQICDHRDGDNGDDVTLYYPGFQHFIDQCNDATYKCRPEEYTFIEHVCTQMSKYMPKKGKKRKKCEAIRQNAFIKLFNQYFNNNLTPDDNLINDLADKIYDGKEKTLGPNDDDAMQKGGGYKLDGYVDPYKCVILEVKNESGQGGESDSYAQAIAYYVKTLEDKPVGRCPAPAFLLELVGSHLFISGAVYGSHVFVDRLVDPVWLVPDQKEEAMIRITKIFKELKEAIGRIQLYYALKTHVSQPRFPIFQSFNEGKIQYEEAIKHHTFKGTLTYHDETSEPVFVTFVKRYSHETHELMVPHGHAPRLIHHEERVGGTQYTAIVMEYIPDARPLDEFLLSEVVEQYRISTCCIEALKVMHEDGYCHGKISSKSIFGKFQDGRIKILIVNYEWAGRQGEARYPLSADIPEGVQPGDLITQEHDEEQLDELLPYGLDRLFQ